MKIGQAGIGTQLTNYFVNMAYAGLVAIGLVYLLLVPLVTVLVRCIRAPSSRAGLRRSFSPT